MEFNIVPFKSIDIFCIGSPLGKVIKDSQSKYPEADIKISHCHENPLGFPCLVKLNSGLLLKFGAVSQKLLSLEIKVENQTLLYNGKIFSSPQVSPTFSLIFKTFGPTHQGSIEGNEYLLKYPGITFGFDIPDGLTIKNQELPILLSDDSTPLCTKIVVETPKEAEIARVNVEGVTGPFTVKLGYTCQDVLCEIGSPLDIMHKSSQSSTFRSDDVSAGDYFWTYYELGIDLLFDGSTHSVKKIILHTNFLYHHELLNYQKCHFKMGKITDQTNFSDVKKALGEPIGPPVIFNLDYNPFGATSYYGYEGVLFEILKSGNIASVTLFEICC